MTSSKGAVKYEIYYMYCVNLDWVIFGFHRLWETAIILQEFKQKAVGYYIVSVIKQCQHSAFSGLTVI